MQDAGDLSIARKRGYPDRHLQKCRVWARPPRTRALRLLGVRSRKTRGSVAGCLVNRRLPIDRRALHTEHDTTENLCCLVKHQSEAAAPNVPQDLPA